MTDAIKGEGPLLARRAIATEALRNNLAHLERTIENLVAWAKSMPEGEIRNKLFDEISALDFIAVCIRRALDLYEGY